MTPRSYLFVPGDSDRKIAKTAETDADALIYDLEDAVLPDRKPPAREMIRATLEGVAAPPFQRWVRINPLDTDDALKDLSAIVCANLDGIVQPKIRTGADITMLCHILSALETREGVAQGRIRIFTIATETPEIMFRLDELAGASPRLAATSWGGEDLGAALGAENNRDEKGNWDKPYELARSLCLFAAVAAGVQPVDTVQTDFRDDDSLRLETRAARRQGFTGKIAIHPRQVPIINETLTPTAEDVAHAEAVVAAFDQGGGSGAVSLDGQMLDIPHRTQALRIIERATALSGGGRPRGS